MKFLIVAAVIACAYAAPSAVVPLAPLAATVSPGDLQAAAIDASVKATDVAQHVFDQTNEAHVEAIAAHEERSWEAVDAVKSAQAAIDGAAAAVAPEYANQARNAPIAPVAPIAPLGYNAAVAPLAYNAAVAPLAYNAAVAPLAYNAAVAPLAYNAAVAPAHYGYSAPLVRAW